MHRKFLRDSLLCLIPVVLAAIVVIRAWIHYDEGKGGFKLGVDLVGGTILIYEVDQELENRRRSLEKDAPKDTSVKTSQALAEAIKRRIDPSDTYNITVRPAGESRIEVILPTGSHRRNAEGKKEVTEGDVAKIRHLIEQVGSLEFRIVANEHDDGKAFSAAEKMFDDAKASELDALAVSGRAPPAPRAPADDPWEVKGVPAKYDWVELGINEREEMGLLNSNEKQDSTKQSKLWKDLREARAQHKVYRYVMPEGKNRSDVTFLLYSRDCVSAKLSKENREKKKVEYFILTRYSDRVEVDGTRVTVSATVGSDNSGFGSAVHFRFNPEGGRQFHAVTSRNKPDQDGRVVRHLAIILNSELISYPTIESAIQDNGTISGKNMGPEKVTEIVKLIRSGALPATLKQIPVSENMMGPTLGADTIKSGTRAVGLAFLAILIFMAVYYRFAGLVACIALLANLLLTVAVMVFFNATFTLPGLAGLVLMLGMAVDANVLIYERLREERDKGANLLMAIRNAYDRAFPTIIDTHVSSIFTAIVLYAFGNDQLKGFGVSLTVGLVISLFTSLFMTRLLFDIWMKKHWLTNLKMMRLLSKPSIDFMKIRHLMFATTGVLTILGIGLFLFRGERGLNVDFVGGTVYGGKLQDDSDISKLREIMNDERQEKVLAVESVTKVADDPKAPGRDAYDIKYVNDPMPRRVDLALGVQGNTPEEKAENLKARASHVPDWSVEQNFLHDSVGDKSKYFTVRTTEKEPELVKAAIDRLFRDKDNSLLAQTLLSVEAKDGNAVKDVSDHDQVGAWVLKFKDRAGGKQYASEAYIRTLLERRFRTVITDQSVLEPFQLEGVGAPEDGRFAEMVLTLSDDAKKVGSLDTKGQKQLLKEVENQYAGQAQPERLETFDATLAGETRTGAMWAIIASWGAILLYLWLRFGNWTFGAAAVICLIHDLCFTLGCIAACHYVSDTWVGKFFGLQDFKIDFAAVAALLTLVGYSVNDTIVVFDRIREVRGKNPLLTSQMINDSVNQTLSRTVLASLATWLVVVVLYLFGGDGVHLFAFVMVVGVIVGTYSSIYVASPLLLIFGEGKVAKRVGISAPATRETVPTS